MREAGKDVKRRPDAWKEQKARMVIKVKDGDKWVVEAFNNIHLHELSSPSKVLKIWSHKKMTPTWKKLIDELVYCGIDEGDFM